MSLELSSRTSTYSRSHARQDRQTLPLTSRANWSLVEALIFRFPICKQAAITVLYRKGSRTKMRTFLSCGKGQSMGHLENTECGLTCVSIINRRPSQRIRSDYQTAPTSEVPTSRLRQAETQAPPPASSYKLFDKPIAYVQTPDPCTVVPISVLLLSDWSADI